MTDMDYEFDLVCRELEADPRMQSELEWLAQGQEDPLAMAKGVVWGFVFTACLGALLWGAAVIVRGFQP